MYSYYCYSVCCFVIVDVVDVKMHSETEQHEHDIFLIFLHFCALFTSPRLPLSHSIPFPRPFDYFCHLIRCLRCCCFWSSDCCRFCCNAVSLKSFPGAYHSAPAFAVAVNVAAAVHVDVTLGLQPEKRDNNNVCIYLLYI